MATPKLESNGKTWAIRVTYTNSNGVKEQKHRGGFKTANQAIAWSENYRNAAEKALTTKNDLKFFELCDKFMAVKRAYRKKGKPLAPRTIADYEIYIDILKKSFGNILLRKITPTFLQERYDMYSKTPCKQAHIEQTLSAIFSFAELQGFTEKNLWLRVVKSEYAPKPENQVWYNAEQIKILLQYLKTEQPKYYVYAKLLTITGLRPNEATVIEESDFRFSVKDDIYFLNVNKALSIVYTKNGRFTEIKEPKSTAGQRELPVTLLDYDDIHAFKIKNRINSPYLLVNEKGKQLTENSFYQAINRTTKRHNLPHITPYGLRRSFANLNKSAGVDPFTVAKLMGHSDVEVTNRHYFKDDIELNKKAVQAVSASLSND